MAKEPEIEERGLLGGSESCLSLQEQSREGRSWQKQQENPSRAEGAELHDGEEHTQDGDSEQDRAGNIQLLALRSPRSSGLPYPGQREHDGDDADRQIDEEYEPPAELGSTKGDEQPTDDRTQSRRYGEGESEAPEGPAAFRAGKGVLDVARNLGAEHSPEEPLNHPGHDDEDRIGREANGRTRCDEPDQPDDEDATAAANVPEPAADDRHQAEREHIAGDDPLQFRWARTGRAAYRRKRHIRDAHIEQRGELTEKQHPESAPATRIGRCRACTGSCIRHSTPSLTPSRSEESESTVWPQCRSAINV